jgi:hypothetical protein
MCFFMGGIGCHFCSLKIRFTFCLRGALSQAVDDETACDGDGREIPAGGSEEIEVSQLGNTENRYFNVTNKDLVNEGKYTVTVL